MGFFMGKKFKTLVFLALGAFFITGCATGSSQSATNFYNKNKQSYQTSTEKREKNPNFNLKKYTNTRIGGDCSGLITAINKNNNSAIFDPKELNKYYTSGRKSQAMFDLYKDKNKIYFSQPQVGDLVFFNNTTRATKGRSKKLITHVGIVSKVNKDGSVEFLHNTGGKNVVSVMNLSLPNDHQIAGKKVNAYIISRCKDSSCLVSNRFSGYGRVK
ncbi:MAG: C40 family peptidase [Campylobacter sp.]|uniref:CHAP domain-containing protein n=1 Tax=Campylobacter sp. TaxID=205 RepID=UPI002AA71934|nr:CHAP domain-containing protein [Campylobacter sp.]MCI7246751.1 C40 family peptidase [Campylobacter sp.]